MSTQTAEVEIKIVSSEAGHRVVVTADGEEVHSTIDYPDRDFATLHAKELGERAQELILRHAMR